MIQKGAMEKAKLSNERGKKAAHEKNRWRVCLALCRIPNQISKVSVNNGRALSGGSGKIGSVLPRPFLSGHRIYLRM